MNGIWTSDISVFNAYCSNSADFLTGPLEAAACVVAGGKTSLQSQVAGDLRDSTVINKMQQAHALHFANEADVAVPSWYATNPNDLQHDVLLDSSCQLDNGNIQSLLQDPGAHHGCVLDAAASQVATLVQTGTAPPGSQPNETLRVQINWTTQDTIPLSNQATIQLAHPGGGFSASRTVSPDPNHTSGSVTFDNVPFTDLLVTTSCSDGGTFSSGGILPGFDRSATLSVTLLCQ